MSNQIHAAGNFRRGENDAASTITPGMLIELDSSAEVKAHATEGGYAERAFAVEDALQGNTITDDYSAADLVSFNIYETGAELYAFLKAGENVSIADKLVSAGDGTLIAEGSVSSGVTVKQIVAMALEAEDLSGSGDVATLIKVRVL